MAWKTVPAWRGAAIRTELARGKDRYSTAFLLAICIRPGVLTEQLVERVDGENLPGEDAAEVARKGVSGCLQGDGLGRFELQRGDAAVGDAAGDDPFEVAEVGGDVKGEAVRGDALRDVDADGG